MRKERLLLLTVLMGTAVISVAVIQYYYLQKAIRLKSELFDRSVYEALSNVSTKLEKQEFRTRITALKKRKKMLLNSETVVAKKKDIKLKTSFIPKIRIVAHNDFGEDLGDVDFEAHFMHFDRVQRELQRKMFSKEGMSIDSIFENTSPMRKLQRKHRMKEKLIKANLRYADSLKRLKHQLELLRGFLVNEFDREKVPLSKRIPFHRLDSVLRQEFRVKNIKLDFCYKLEGIKQKELIYVSDKRDLNLLSKNDAYEVLFFADDMFNGGGKLTIYFPDKDSVLLEKMTTVFFVSFGLLFVVISCFGYTVYTVIRQRKVSDMKTEFINNMTHEFKTPVSTIMIASEALQNISVGENSDRVKHLANIIYDENERLTLHIERVLNMAKLDSPDFHMDSTPIIMNDLVTAIVDSISLQVDKKQASVSFDLQAKEDCILGDELHLSNVILNLIDNALKYSSKDPMINIVSFNQNGEYVLIIKDNGIGMEKDQVSKIFDQFYRVSTGNVHNAKGFGLGLSYVYSIIKKMGAKVVVRSEKSKGSEFELRFVLYNKK